MRIGFGFGHFFGRIVSFFLNSLLQHLAFLLGYHEVIRKECPDVFPFVALLTRLCCPKVGRSGELGGMEEMGIIFVLYYCFNAKTSYPIRVSEE